MPKANELNPLVTALNLIMRRQAAQLGPEFPLGKGRFFDGHKELLGPRLLALMGFYSSVRPIHRQLMVTSTYAWQLSMNRGSYPMPCVL